MKSLLIVLAATLASSATAFAGDIEVTSPWLRATPHGATVAGGYATIVNHGRAPDRLVGASLAVAPKGEVHEMSMKDGVMHMARLADGLPIAPGAKVTLAPGSYHLMFPNPTAQLKEGETIAGSLTFAKAGEVFVTFAVAGFGAKSAPGAPVSAEHDMPGMKLN